jgi:predicted Fe-S protein YdhL (DUF1289 family)
MRIWQEIQTVPRHIKLIVGLEMSENTEEIQSPCIGVCSMDEATGFCHGCYRTIDEIKGWWNMAPAEQKSLLTVLETRQNEMVSFDD